MKSELFKKLFGVLCCLSLLLLSSAAFGVGFEKPAGEPPYGLKLEGAAKGTKVNVTVAAEFTDLVRTGGVTFANKTRVIARTRHGSELVTFFEVIELQLDLADPEAIQAAIIAAIGPNVLATYGNNGESNVVLKDAEELAGVTGPGMANTSVAIMIDAILALN